VKLLFDENLSPKLPELLEMVYPGSTHVKHCGLNKASDAEVWEYAKAHGFVILSKDSDFQDRSMLWGSPPKVIWLRIPNCASVEVAEVLRNAMFSDLLHTKARCAWSSASNLFCSSLLPKIEYSLRGSLASTKPATWVVGSLLFH